MRTLLGAQLGAGAAASAALRVADAGKRRAVPEEAAGLEFAAPQKVACGGAHTLYLTQAVDGDDGHATGAKVLGWGGNRHNALGLRRGGEERDEEPGRGGGRWEPCLPVPSDAAFCDQMALSDEQREARRRHRFLDLFEVACGSNHSAVLERVKAATPDDAAVAGAGAGAASTSMLLAESRLWAFGLGANGQLGSGAGRDVGGEDQDLPAEVSMPSVPGARVVVQRVSCGADHTLAIANHVGHSGSSMVAAGRVYAWGLGSYGALGSGGWADEWTPREVWFPGDRYGGDTGTGVCERCAVICQVAAGAKHSLALGDDGTIYTWGHGGNGRLGLGRGGGSASYGAESRPRRIEQPGARMRYIAAGEAHSACVDKLGGLYTWGQGSHGRCGHGMGFDVEVPTRVESLMGVAISQIALGLMHSVATTAKGRLYAWGKGPATGLDAGNNEVVPTPRLVDLPEREPVYQVAAGPLHTVVLMCDGALLCFGSGSDGRMPFKSVGESIAAHRDQSFPKKLDVKYRGWCVKTRRRTDQEEAASPTTSAGARERDPAWWPSHLFCGGAHSALLTSASEADAAAGMDNLYFWGSSVLTSSTEGSRGQPEGRDQWQPAVLKRGFRRPTRTIAIGLHHCLAVTVEGAMYAWGDGSKGQLGTGSLSGCAYPQLVSHPTGVTRVAAGEEHSACIIEGGEAYTWGNADGGRLGLGRCSAEGCSLVPRHVQAGGDGAEAVLLRGVACGSQHTAFISEGDLLLSCGTGWFGRLGQGSTDNKYSLGPVGAAGLRVKDVFCALYHTCIVDQDDVLWVCGRDSSTCRMGAGHLLEPAPFEPFAQEPRRLIRSLATADQHTLAVTSCPSQDGAIELWVWGKNNRGQLGLPETETVRVDMPWQLRLPGLPERHQPFQVATGPGHSLCLARPARVPKRLQRAPDWQPVVYAWGAAAAGRLGVTGPEAEAKLAELRQQAVQEAPRQESPPALRLPWLQATDEEDDAVASAPVGSVETRVYPPLAINAVWKPVEELGLEQRERAGLESNWGCDQGVAGPSETWFDAQLKVWQESEEQKARRLEEGHREVAMLYQVLMDEIHHLWDKPAIADATDLTEYQLRQKESDVEREYIRTLMALGLGGSTGAPRLERCSQTDPELRGRLHLCEELVWVLQQQPLYLAGLASHFHGRRGDDAEVEVFHRVTSRIYADMKETRTRNLFKALLRLLMQAETARAAGLEELYEPAKSRAAALLGHMCAAPALLQCLAMPVLDPRDDRSLVSIIIRYTLSRDGETPRKVGTGDPKNQPGFTGVFATSQQEYEALIRQHRAEGNGGRESELPDDVRRRLRQHFQDEVAGFAHLCVKDRRRHRDPEEQADPNEGKISEFIEYFIKEVLKGDEHNKVGHKDIRMLLVRAFTSLVAESRLVHGVRSTQEDAAWLPGVCAPLGALVLGTILGSLLGAVETGPFSLVRLGIAARVRELEGVMLEKWNRLHSRGRSRDDARQPAEAQPDTKGLARRVFWNIQALAKFFQNVFHKSTAEGLQEVRDCAAQLRGHTCKYLLGVLSEQSASGEASAEAAAGEAMKGRCCEYGEDTTETELTVDLYTAQYSLRQSVVRLSTVDLLELSNLLWRYMEPGSRAREGTGVRINPREHDRVYQLVRAILPRKRTARGVPTDEVVPWSKDGHIWLASEHGEWHNFRMRARFLEFDRTGEQEPTFCEASQAPIPRFLAREEQRVCTGVHAVKPFRVPEEEMGPLVELGGGQRVYAFARLEELLQELAGNVKECSALKYPIHGAAFGDLRTEFEYLQNRISRDIEEGRAGHSSAALVQSLDTGKQLIDRIPDKDPRALLQYIDRGVQRRGAYKEYLQRTKDGAEGIRRAQLAYRGALKEQYMLLSRVAAASQSCELPEAILTAAQQRSERLAFARAKRAKLKRRKDHPTAAQAVLDALRIASTDGKVTEEMKEMVGVPSRSFRLKQLTDRGVVVKLNEKIHGNVRGKMCFNFQCKDEGYIVQIFMKTTLLKEFAVSRQDIRLAETGRKNAVLPYGDEFLWLNCFRLRRLLAFIAAEGGL